jgi:oligopeptide/dipeptide ABC transporter ATP-binding protein
VTSVPAADRADALLEVRDLTVRFPGSPPSAHAVSFTLDHGDLLGVVGESGSGKSVTMMALLGLLPTNAIVSGSVRFDGEELLEPTGRRLRAVRGRSIAIVFQDPLSALNPGFTVGSQIGETLRLHRPRLGRAERRARAIAVLRDVGLPDGANLLRRFPHELSGGMRQRVLLAVALAGDPKVLLADEPTTALDVTLAAEILDLLDELRSTRDLAVVLVSHDLNLVASRCTDVLVMYSGEVVERADAASVFGEPAHPYTRMLVDRTLDPFVPHTLTDAPSAPHLDVRADRGCVFAPRCPVRIDRCAAVVPPTIAVGPRHAAACHLLTEVPVR